MRVFVSSTFRDLKAEREELMKHTFPRLRKLCEQRGVTWSEVDLRWGINEEQTAEGRVLPICLAEIERCRPYFIGVLGERYGWVPEEIEPDLIRREPWLSTYSDRSVTELEIVHGVLRNTGEPSHAFLYLRDPTYADALPEKEQRNLQELPSPNEVERLGAEEAERRAAERREKLAALKKRIRKRRVPVREGYADPKALGELVLTDLTGVIDRLYPRGSEPDPLDREAAEHEAFARSRAGVIDGREYGVYIGGESYYDRLDEHVRDGGAPLVVLGESGSGKSALLSNWALRHRAAHPDELVLMHFIGANPYSADWAAMLRRVMGELARRFEIEGEIPDDAAQLRTTFADWLHMAAKRGRVVLVLDALNQLEDRDGAPDLVWLPPVIPPNVKLILSTLPGRPLEEIDRRGWPALEVEPLERKERERLIARYLGQYAKELSNRYVERIVAAPQSANPLYLRALLEELRLWGEHETLNDAIEHYLGAAEITDLYARILARYEADYERDRPGLVGEAMSLLWAARRGLSEAELLELLGSGDEPLPHAHWSPLYLAAEQSLVSRSGLIGFFHDYLREAIRRRYLGSVEERNAIHLRLAGYFRGRDPGVRRSDELPWQLAEAGAWQRLAALLGDLSFFESAWDHDQFEVKRYWARVEANSPLRAVEVYRRATIGREVPAHRLSLVARLLHDTGHQAEALGLRARVAEHCRRSGDRVNLATALGHQAATHYDLGELDQAMVLLEEQERICRELGDRAGLQMALAERGLVAKARGQPEKAGALWEEQERICRELGHRVGVARCLVNRAGLLFDLGELDAANALCSEQERLSRELGDPHLLQASLGGQAAVLKAQGDLDGAVSLLTQQERICRELGDRTGLLRPLRNKALVLQDRGSLDEALELHREEERISRELHNPAVLQLSLGSQGVILTEQGRDDEAMALYGEKERLCRDLGDPEGLTTAIGSRAKILWSQGRLDEALALHQEEERICHEMGYVAGLPRSIRSQAGIIASQGLALGRAGRLREALPLLEEAHRMATAHGLTHLAEQVEPALHAVRRSVSIIDRAPP